MWSAVLLATVTTLCVEFWIRQCLRLHTKLDEQETISFAPTGMPFSQSMPRNKSLAEIRHLAKSYFVQLGSARIDKQKFEQLVRSATDLRASRGATVIIQVLDGKIYVDRSHFTTPYPWDKLRMHFILGRIQKIIRNRKRSISNFELILNTHDCPLRGFSEGPIFTITKCHGTKSIPIPQWFRWRDANFGNWNRRMNMYYETSESVPWIEKENRAVFRGSVRPSTLVFDEALQALLFKNVTSECWRELGRTKLWDLGRSHPHLLDVGLYGMGAAELQDLSAAMSWEYKPPITMQNQSLSFKYSVYVEGACGWADRLKVQLASGAVVLLQETPCHEFFRPLLQPYVHYIPISNSLDDLINKVKWLTSHDTVAREISHAAADFAHVYLRQEAWDFYLEAVLDEYANMLDYIPTRRANTSRFIKESQCPNLRNYKCNDEECFSTS